MICKSDKRDKSASPSSLCWKEHAGSDWTVVWEEREKKEEDEEREDDDDEERELRVKGGRVGRVEKEVRERTGGVIGKEREKKAAERERRRM